MAAASKYFGATPTFDDIQVLSKHVFPSTEEGQSNLDALLMCDEDEGLPPPVFFIDNLSMIVDGNENDTEAATRLLNPLVRFAREYGATFIIISHAGKDALRGVAGSHKFGAYCMAVWDVTKTSHTMTFTNNMMRTADPAPMEFPLATVTLSPVKPGAKPKDYMVVDHNRVTEVETTTDESGNAARVVKMKEADRTVIGLIQYLVSAGQSTTLESIKGQAKLLYEQRKGECDTDKKQDARRKFVERIKERIDAMAATEGKLGKGSDGQYYVTENNMISWGKRS